MKEPKEIKIAKINARAVILAAIITGVFSLVAIIISLNSKKNGNVTSTTTSQNDTSGKVPERSENGAQIKPGDSGSLPTITSERESQPAESVKSFKVFVDVNLDRAGSKVYIDGELKGKAPDTFDIKAGPGHLKLTYMDPYGDQWEYQDSIYVSKAITIRVKDNSWIRSQKR